MHRTNWQIVRVRKLSEKKKQPHEAVVLMERRATGERIPLFPYGLKFKTKQILNKTQNKRSANDSNDIAGAVG